MNHVIQFICSSYFSIVKLVSFAVPLHCWFVVFALCACWAKESKINTEKNTNQIEENDQKYPRTTNAFFYARIRIYQCVRA